MILVAGLTPAWQQILSFESLLLGEVNRALESQWCASGKVLNVGLALAHLGIAAHTLSPVGGWVREPIMQEFQRFGAAATWVVTSAVTRVCTTILDRSRSQTTELVQNATPLAESELRTFCDHFTKLSQDADVMVLTGSLPHGTRSEIFADLLRTVRVPMVLDIRGPELLAALPARPALIKPNRDELATTVGRMPRSEADLVNAARELINQGAQAVLISQGKSPALLVTAEQAWRIVPAAVERVENPIGCGDCLAAGVAWGLQEGRTLVDSVRLGMGCAADNLRDRLPARLDRERVEELAAQVRIVAL